ncbi:hypothetical protein Tco_1511556, partial [Tanacetum coccineum]
TGRLGFARVSIEVKANKGLPDNIEIVYKGKEGFVTVKEKGINDDNNKDCNLNNDGSKSKEVEKGSPSNKNRWKVQDDIIDSIRKSANKFFVLVEEDEESNNDSLNEFMKEEQDVYE